MPRNKDPAVLFFTSDFLAGTMLMSFEQKGKYITLLCLQHLNGHMSKDDMIGVCGDVDAKIFAKFKQDENGLYYNERMEEETQKRKAYSESRRLNISKRYEPTQEGTYEDTYVGTSELHMGNGNINENINSTDNKGTIIAETNKEGAHARNGAPQRVKKQPQKPQNEVDEVEMRFTRFWKQYPKKVAKMVARMAFTRLDPDDDLLGVMLAALERQKASEAWTKDDGRYIPYPATWINQRRWEDEETPPPGTIAKYSTLDANSVFAAAVARSYGGDTG